MDIDCVQSPFELTCLHPENANLLNKNISKFLKWQLNQTSYRSARKIGNAGPLAKDFTPWWNDFSKPLTQKCTSKNLSKDHNDSDRYESWFQKAGGHGWLAGPVNQGSSHPQVQKSKVEDIPVPSIYEETLKTKGRRALKRERKAEREKTLGKNWYGMRAPDKDDPVRKDFELIQMRGVLDPKRFYKHQDRKAVPKYFQMGTVMDEGTDFYGSRLTKKQRKSTLVEELMADANIRKYNKKKYAELQHKMRGKKKQSQKDKKR